MERAGSSELTEKQRYWLNHIETARSRKQPLAQYAKEHQLELKALYNYQGLLKHKGILEAPAAPAFVRVKPKSSVEIQSILQVHIQFGNQMQATIQAPSTESLQQILQVVKTL
jgi:hypothetical protein